MKINEKCASRKIGKKIEKGPKISPLGEFPPKYGISTSIMVLDHETEGKEGRAGLSAVVDRTVFGHLKCICSRYPQFPQ